MKSDMKNKEKGAAFLIILVIVALLFVGVLLIMYMLGSGNSDVVTGGDSTEDPYLMSPVNVPFDGCLFHKRHPKVARYLREDPAFPGQLTYYSKGLGYTPNDMMSMFYIECTFNFNVVNAYGCGGMFQLCPQEIGGPKRAAMGITPRELAALSPSRQLPYLDRYFRLQGCHRDPPAAKTPAHAYLCVFLPGKRNKKPSDYIWPRGANPGHDVDNDGKIYKWEVDCNMQTSYAIGGTSCGLNIPRCSRSKIRSY